MRPRKSRCQKQTLMVLVLLAVTAAHTEAETPYAFRSMIPGTRFPAWRAISFFLGPCGKRGRRTRRFKSAKPTA